MECVRNRVNGFTCPPNGDCSCDKDFSGLVTPEIAQLFEKYPDYNSVIFTKEGEMVVISISR